MKRTGGLLLSLIFLTFMGCKKDVKPKPKAYLALHFPPHEYQTVQGDCPYTFELNEIAEIKRPEIDPKPCNINIVYPKMKGVIYITYEPVHGNLKNLLKDAQELPLHHAIKADEIFGDEYADSIHHTYGMLYTVTGDAASQNQFYLTDSTRHFITGSLYFKLRPQYDSLYPAASYIKEDMKKLMESLRWE